MNDKTKDALECLEKGLETLLDAENWVQYLRFQSNFHRYSFHNQILIWAQCPNATYCAGFQQWRKMNRHVCKGERGLAILAPLIRKTDSDECLENTGQQQSDGENGTQKKVLFGYRTVYVWDVSQTDGEPLPMVSMPEVVQGDTELYARLQDVCPFPVIEVSLGDGIRGSFNHQEQRIRVADDMPEAQKAKTLVHEWAHGLLHSLSTRRPDKETRELEAESTAYVVCHALGLDTSSYSFSYITGWSGKEAIETLKLCGSRIQKAADAILSALEAEPLLKEAV
jgi:hypothetical protein